MANYQQLFPDFYTTRRVSWTNSGRIRDSTNPLAIRGRDPVAWLQLLAFRKLSNAEKNTMQRDNPGLYMNFIQQDLYSLDRRFIEKLRHHNKKCNPEEVAHYLKEALIQCLYSKYPILKQIHTKGGIQIKQFTSVFFSCICPGYNEPFLWKEPRDLGNLDSPPVSNLRPNSSDYNVHPSGTKSLPPFPVVNRLQSAIIGPWAGPVWGAANPVRLDTLPRITTNQFIAMATILFPGWTQSQQQYIVRWNAAGMPIAGIPYLQELLETIPTVQPVGIIVGDISLNHTKNLLNSIITQILWEAYRLFREESAIHRLQRAERRRRNILDGPTTFNPATGTVIRRARVIKLLPQYKELSRVTRNFKITNNQVDRLIRVFTKEQLRDIIKLPYTPYGTYFNHFQVRYFRDPTPMGPIPLGLDR